MSKLVSVAVFLCSACEVLIPYASRGAPGDSASPRDGDGISDSAARDQRVDDETARDGRPRDGAGDGAPARDFRGGGDRALADASPSRDTDWPPDLALLADVPPPDAGLSPDLAPDAGLSPDLAPAVDQSSVTVDAPVAPDLGLADLTVPTNACSNQTQVEVVAQWTPGKMVLCKNTSGSGANQCDADKMCNAQAGWQLCTATQYVARGGDRAAPATAGWLKSCIRSGGAPYAPSDTTCVTRCKSESLIGFADVSWTCAGSWRNGNSAPYLGVVSFPGCKRIGSNSASSAGWWTYRVHATREYAAVCCHP